HPPVENIERQAPQILAGRALEDRRFERIRAKGERTPPVLESGKIEAVLDRGVHGAIDHRDLTFSDHLLWRSRPLHDSVVGDLAVAEHEYNWRHTQRAKHRN